MALKLQKKKKKTGEFSAIDYTGSNHIINIACNFTALKCMGWMGCQLLSNKLYPLGNLNSVNRFKGLVVEAYCR